MQRFPASLPTLTRRLARAIACVSLFAAPARADEQVTVSLRLTDAVGQSGPAAFEVYRAGSATGDSRLTMADLPDPEALRVELEEGTGPWTKFLRGRIFPGGVKPAQTEDEQEERSVAILEGLNQQLATADLYQPDLLGPLKLPPPLVARLTKIPRDGKGLDPKEIQQANRELLEAAYPTLISRSGTVASTEADATSTTVSPGSYLLVPRDFPALSQPFVAVAGHPSEVVVTAPDALWLRFGAEEKSARQVILPLKSPAERRSAVARVKPVAFERNNVGMLRPGVAPAERQKALALARDYLAQYKRMPLPAEGDATARRLFNFNVLDYGNATRILLVAGDPGDAAVLAKAREPDLYAALGLAANIGYLEARLGRLDRGELVAGLKADPIWSFACAALLHSYGLKAGDDGLRATLARVADWDATRLAAQFLLDDPAPATLAGMRAQLNVVFNADGTPQESIHGLDSHPLLYLLAYGNPDDWRKIAKLTLHPAFAPGLVPIASDPRPLARVGAGFSFQLALAESGLRTLPPLLTAAYTIDFENAIYQAYSLTAENPDFRADPDRILNYYRVYSSYLRPSRDIARAHFGANITLDYASWIPWYDDTILDGLASGANNQGSYPVLDYLPHARLIEELDRRKVRAGFPGTDLFLANHLLVSRVFLANVDADRDDALRRPFAVADGPNEGAISGVMELRPTLAQRHLVLDFTFLLKAYYHVGALIDFNQGDVTQWAHHKYMVDGGRLLIGRVALRRGDQAVPVTARPAQPGEPIRYEADLGQDDLSGVLADVELQFFEQKFMVTFDLFASDYARGLRRAAGGLKTKP